MLTQSTLGLTILATTHILDVRVPVPIVAGAMMVVGVVSFVSAGGYVRGWATRRAEEAASRSAERMGEALEEPRRVSSH
jgi:hypothetical protein